MRMQSMCFFFSPRLQKEREEFQEICISDKAADYIVGLMLPRIEGVELMSKSTYRQEAE